MTSDDVNKLLEKYPLGVIITFRHELEKWQKSSDKVGKNVSISDSN